MFKSKLLGGVVAVAVLGSVVGFAATRSLPDATANDERPRLTAADVPLLGGDATQQEALADLSASQEERRAGADAAVACIRAAGIAVSEPGWDGQQYKYTAGPFATKAELDAAKPTLNECYNAHLRGLEVVASAAE